MSESEQSDSKSDLTAREQEEQTDTAGLDSDSIESKNWRNEPTHGSNASRHAPMTDQDSTATAVGMRQSPSKSKVDYPKSRNRTDIIMNMNNEHLSNSKATQNRQRVIASRSAIQGRALLGPANP